MKPRIPGLIAVSLAAGFVWPVAGHPAEIPPLLETCVGLSRDSERLVCYDKAIAAIKRGDEGSTPVTAENMFGAGTGVTRTDAEKREVKREELRQISGTVTSLRRGDDGMITLELDNGQVWRQTDSNVSLLVATGDKVTIARASLGTFRIADKTGRFARFSRVR